MTKKNKVLMGILVLLLCLSVTLYQFVLVPNYRAREEEKINSEKKKTREQALQKEHEEAKQIKKELQEQIDAYLQNEKIDTSGVSIYIETMDDEIVYDLNGDVQRVAASTYKLPLAVIWYDKVNANEIALDDTLTYLPNCYEEGGPIGANYEMGSEIPLEELLEEMIVNSDNTAGHILFEHLGGWCAFKEVASNYSNAPLSDEFFSIDNYLSAHYASDIVNHIWKYQDGYAKLIDDMQLAMPHQYLDQTIKIKMAQKYGEYDAYENAVGFVPCKRTYSICVYTDLGTKGIDMMAEINVIAYQVLNA